MMVHWGLYSMLAGEYRGKPSNSYAEWIMSAHRIPIAEYENLAKRHLNDLGINYLINIGPDALGRFPAPAMELLEKVAKMEDL